MPMMHIAVEPAGAGGAQGGDAGVVANGADVSPSLQSEGGSSGDESPSVHSDAGGFADEPEPPDAPVPPGGSGGTQKHC